MRCTVRIVVIGLCFALMLLNARHSFSQDPAQMTLAQAGSMPAWVVPVLRLVSATHVEPTTGVVISSTGLVLVSDDFASPGDEIIVLDGGTDLVRNGRPAKILQRFPSEGLMVLSVMAFNRNAFQFSVESLADGNPVRLHAFPPAELIEQGAPPVDEPATIFIHPESGATSISIDTPLPNVSGPLLDTCGNLTGYSTADGVQSMSTSESPRYNWKDGLLAILGEMQIDIIETSCQSEPTPPEPQQAEPETETIPEPEPEPEIPPEDSLVETETDANEISEETVLEEQDPDEESLSELEILPPIEDNGDLEEDTSKAPSQDEDSGIPAWVWLIIAVLLLGSAYAVHRYRNKQLPGAANEPEALLGEDSSQGSGDSDDEPEFTSPGLDSLLQIEGILADGTEFRHSCKVSRNAVNIVIGRSGTDIIIDSAAVTRQHASLNGNSKVLTITDLGSSNGTSINGVPCLEGEVMYVEPGDIIILGNARFTYDIVPATEA